MLSVWHVKVFVLSVVKILIACFSTVNWFWTLIPFVEFIALISRAKPFWEETLPRTCIASFDELIDPMLKPTPLEDVISPKAIAYEEVFTLSILIPLPWSELMVFNSTAKSALEPVAVIGCSTTKAYYPWRPILDWMLTRLQGNPQVKSLVELISSPN